MKFSEWQKEYNASRDKMENYLKELTGEDLSIIDNREDDHNDIRVHFEDGSLSPDTISTILEYFEITFINVDGTQLQIDLREK